MSMNTLRYKLHNSWIMKVVLGGTVAAMLVTAYMGLGSNSPNRLPGGMGDSGSGPDSAVMSVNGTSVTESSYKKQMDTIQQQMSQSGQQYSILMQPGLHAKALQNAIDIALLLQEAKRRGITASDAEVAKERSRAVASSNIASEIGLAPNASTADIDSALARAGQPALTVQFPDEQIRQSIILQKIEKQIEDSTAVTDQEVALPYTSFHTQHILISNKGRSDVQALERANEVIAKAKAPGANFTALAAQYSDDPGSKFKGGDDGFITQNTSYVDEFKKAAFALKPGEITLTPVKSPQYGYFIIKLDAVNQKMPADFTKNKAKYMQDAKSTATAQALQDLITKLRADPTNKIEITDPQLRADRELGLASTGVGDMTTNLNNAIADYQTALKNSPSLSKTTEINIGLTSAYSGKKDDKDTIAALKAAADNSSDAELYLALGQLYAKDKQNALGIAAVNNAVQNSLDDQQIHSEAMSLYEELGAKAQVTDELKWLASHRQDNAPQGGMSLAPASPAAGKPMNIVIPPAKTQAKAAH